METPEEKKEMQMQKEASLSSIPAAIQWKRAALMAKNAASSKENIADDSDAEDVDTKQQIQYGNTCQATCGILKEYCDYSTIHGFRYLGEIKRPRWERLFWVFVLIFSIYTCATLIMNIWDKWNNNPVIVSFAEKSTPVWQIPFPTVTVCTETKGRQRVFNFTEIYWRITDKLNNVTDEELTDEERVRMEAMAQVCDVHLFADLKFGHKATSAAKVVDALAAVTPQFNESYLHCKWRNLPENCQQMFQKFITEEGVCYSFNSLSAKEIYRPEGIISEMLFQTDNRTATDWNVEDGYSASADPETYPERVLGPGARAGLYMVLNGFEQDFDNLCRGPVQGFKIILHTPGEVAQISKQYFRIPFDQEVLISIKPKIITTSEGLRYYEPHRRQCYFQKERHLRYFQIYTQSNCELECLSNFTLSKCGCVKFSMPHTPDTPVCGAINVKCINEAEDELLLKEFNQGAETAEENVRGRTECDCLPSCTSIAYEAEISQSDFDYKLVANTFKEEESTRFNANNKMSRVSIFFKEAQFLTSRRSELYGTTDFLANCGGLLGLFMGVSILSIVEIAYFCSVRLCTNLRMRHTRRKELENNDEIVKDA
ncbi:pickpocket protein 28 [Rhagoletis pomonella]|uniref:pickpocket protein 28 n=1 Tax=Rhagoletis pomonella TaxID=28610 RepID=UPI0017848540|nr:pickpocket protein 28 [Rhagoletis pomonella]